MKFPKKAERMNLRIGTDIYFSNIKRVSLERRIITADLDNS